MPRPISKGTAKSDIVVLPNDTNHYGNIFGGALLSFMDRTAFIAARKYAENDLVTVALQDMVFKAPIKVGATAEISAKVCYVGKTSLDVCVTVMSGDKIVVDNAKFVFVSIGSDGKPIPIVQPSFATAEEKAEFERREKERMRNR
jgi:acyl-CoA hydrolase